MFLKIWRQVKIVLSQSNVVNILKLKWIPIICTASPYSHCTSRLDNAVNFIYVFKFIFALWRTDFLFLATPPICFQSAGVTRVPSVTNIILFSALIVKVTSCIKDFFLCTKLQLIFWWKHFRFIQLQFFYFENSFCIHFLH